MSYVGRQIVRGDCQEEYVRGDIHCIRSDGYNYNSIAIRLVVWNCTLGLALCQRRGAVES